MIIVWDEPITLGELVDKLEPGEGIIAEFPNGYKKYLTRYSKLDKSDAELPIVKPYKYDCNSKTYHVKISTLEMYLRPSKPFTLGELVDKPEPYEAFRAKELVRTALNSCYGINPLEKAYIENDKKILNKITMKYKMGWCGNMCNDEFPLNGLSIKKIIHNGPATIIFWNDGDKTVVKAQDEIDYEKGILYAALKKLATKKEYNDILRAIDADDIIMNNMDYLFPDRPLSPEEAEEFTKKETPKKKREYKYQKCPVCGKGYNLNWPRMRKLIDQNFIDIRCSGCDTLFRVKGDYNLPKWHTKLEHEVLIKGKEATNNGKGD